MAEIVRMPRLSDTMTEGVIVGWHKKKGDKVSAGDILADVETDKATMELEAYVDGTLLHVGVSAGDAVPIDVIIAIIGEEGEDVQSILDAETSPSTVEVSESEAKVIEKINGSEINNKLEKDIELANELGLRGTPAFIIGNEIIFGYLNYQEMISKINQQ